MRHNRFLINPSPAAGRPPYERFPVQNYAATRRTLGNEMFRQIEAVATRSALPLTDTLKRDSTLLGIRRQKPWIIDLMQLEEYAAQSIHTPPCRALDAATLAAAAEKGPLLICLQPHIRLLRSGWDIPALWQAIDSGDVHAVPVAGESFTAIYNDGGNAALWSLDEAAYLFLESLSTNPGFERAAADALRSHPQFPLDRFLALLIQQSLLTQDNPL